MPSHIKLSPAMASRSNGDARAAATNGTSIKALIVLPPKAKMIAKVQILVDATLVMIDVVKKQRLPLAPADQAALIRLCTPR